MSDGREADPERIERRLEALWVIHRGPGGGADRPAFSVHEADAMQLCAGWAREAGLEPALDAAGNLWAVPAAAAAGAAMVTSGSHVDTVADGGRYDGALGCVLALEAADALRERGDVGLLVCAAEEASRFPAGTIGSRTLTGAVGDDELAGVTDEEGVSALAARAGYLAALGDLPAVDPAPLARVRAHVEVHVEQRHELAAAGLDLGVVDRIAGPRRYEVVVRGAAGHAGELPMADRRDALAAASEIVLAVERAGRAAGGAAVATVGALAVEPGRVSIVPGRVTLQLEVRGLEPQAIDAAETAILRTAEAVGTRRGVAVATRTVRRGEPVALDQRLRTMIGEAIDALGGRWGAVSSGAGHDAQHLAAAGVPAAMIFVPLRGGESHTPEEGVDAAGVALAAAALIETLRRA